MGGLHRSKLRGGQQLKSSSASAEDQNRLYHARFVLVIDETDTFLTLLVELEQLFEHICWERIHQVAAHQSMLRMKDLATAVIRVTTTRNE